MAHDAEADARAVQALNLRLAGASYRSIGTELHVSYQTAYTDVQRMLRETMQEPTDELRQAELARLDRLLLSLWPLATRTAMSPLGPDYRAVDAALRIMERRARLLGLDAPAKIDLTQWVREFAEKHGMDADAAVEKANNIVKAARL